MSQAKTVVDNDALYVQRLTLGDYETNAYLLRCPATGAGVLIDAPDEPAYLTALVRGQTIKYVLLTHAHPDHIGALDAVRALGIPLGAHAGDSSGLSSPPEHVLEDGDQLRFGQLDLKVLHTPGHTPGSLSFLTGLHLFSGDTLFPGGPGRTASPRAFSSIIASIRDKLLPLPPQTVVHPGHGDATTIAEARAEHETFSDRIQPEGLYGDVLWSPAGKDKGNEI